MTRIEMKRCGVGGVGGKVIRHPAHGYLLVMKLPLKSFNTYGHRGGDCDAGEFFRERKMIDNYEPTTDDFVVPPGPSRLLNSERLLPALRVLEKTLVARLDSENSSPEDKEKALRYLTSNGVSVEMAETVATETAATATTEATAAARPTAGSNYKTMKATKSTETIDATRENAESTTGTTETVEASLTKPTVESTKRTTRLTATKTTATKTTATKTTATKTTATETTVTETITTIATDAPSLDDSKVKERCDIAWRRFAKHRRTLTSTKLPLELRLKLYATLVVSAIMGPGTERHGTERPGYEVFSKHGRKLVSNTNVKMLSQITKRSIHDEAKQPTFNIFDMLSC